MRFANLQGGEGREQPSNMICALLVSCLLREFDLLKVDGLETGGNSAGSGEWEWFGLHVASNPLKQLGP